MRSCTRCCPTTRITAQRARALSPEHPVIRGTSQNPDVFFQAREAQNPWFDAFPAVVQQAMDEFAALTGRHYHLFDYVGAPDAERVIVIMGSGADTVEETVAHLTARGEKIGLFKVRLFRPLSAAALLAALPPSVRSLAVLDRCKEPGADGEPLFKDVMVALAEDQADAAPRFAAMPKVIGGRYGLGSKEFNPAMVCATSPSAAGPCRAAGVTIGIEDDVTGLSLPWDAAFRTDAAADAFAAVFYGLGSDGTVSANKNSIKIIGDETALFAQGYFVLRLEEIRRDDGVAPALRPAADPLRLPHRRGRREVRRLSPAAVHRAARRARPRRAAARCSCSTPVSRPTRCGPRYRQRCSAPWWKRRSASGSSTPTRSRSRPAWGGASTP